MTELFFNNYFILIFSEDKANGIYFAALQHAVSINILTGRCQMLL